MMKIWKGSDYLTMYSIFLGDFGRKNKMTVFFEGSYDRGK